LFFPTDRIVVRNTTFHPFLVLVGPVVRHRLAHGHRPVQPHLRAKDIDQYLYGGASPSHRGPSVFGLRPVFGQRISTVGHDGQWCFHFWTSVYNGRLVTEFCQWVIVIYSLLDDILIIRSCIVRNNVPTQVGTIEQC